MIQQEAAGRSIDAAPFATANSRQLLAQTSIALNDSPL
jgi:hypothetical protein